MMISVARQGEVVGQFTLEDAKAAFASGEILTTDHYWHEGLETWRPAGLLAAPSIKLPVPRPASKPSSVLDFLLRRRGEGEVLCALWELLSARSEAGLPSELELIDLERRLGVDIRRRFARKLREWYGQYVAAALSDEVFTEQERRELHAAASLFRIPALEAQQIYQRAVADLYGANLAVMLRASKDIAEARKMVEGLEGRLGLPGSFFAAHRRHAIRDFVSRAVGGATPRPLSPWDISFLGELSELGGMPLRDDAELAEGVKLSESLWLVREGRLPTVDCPLLLDKGEVCHWSSPAEMFRLKRVTTRVHYDGITSSVRIMKGLYWRSGSYSIRRETEDMFVSVDKGVLLITNQRIIFNGQFKNLTIKFAKILDICGYKDAIGFDLAGGVDPRFVIPSHPRLPYELLLYLCKQDRA